MNFNIINRIKKLLQMQRGGTTAEIENAISLAQKLAAKHNIDLSKINPNEDREPITHQNVSKVLSRLQYEVKYSAIIVKRFFNVDAFTTGLNRKYCIIFVGKKTDIEIAQYVFNFLIRHFRNEWKTKRGRLRNRQSFMYGLYMGLYHKLAISEESISQQEGIILADNTALRKAYIQNNFGQLESTSVKPDKEAQAALHKGWQSGINTNIHKGIKTTPHSKMLNM